jgi:hypothetical protein
MNCEEMLCYFGGEFEKHPSAPETRTIWIAYEKQILRKSITFLYLILCTFIHTSLLSNMDVYFA